MTPEEAKGYDELKKLCEELRGELAESRKRVEEGRSEAAAPMGGGAMGPRHLEESPVAIDAAREAAASGRRNDLLRYMRLRRKRK